MNKYITSAQLLARVTERENCVDWLYSYGNNLTVQRIPHTWTYCSCTCIKMLFLCVTQLSPVERKVKKRQHECQPAFPSVSGQVRARCVLLLCLWPLKKPKNQKKKNRNKKVQVWNICKSDQAENCSWWQRRGVCVCAHAGELSVPERWPSQRFSRVASLPR